MKKYFRGKPANANLQEGAFIRISLENGSNNSCSLQWVHCVYATIWIFNNVILSKDLLIF